jgi:hypothetical protein
MLSMLSASAADLLPQRLKPIFLQQDFRQKGLLHHRMTG